MTEATLTQALARRCCADWSTQFDQAQRSALAALVRTAFVDTIACILAGRDEEAVALAKQMKHIVNERRRFSDMHHQGQAGFGGG